ncbi:2-phosphosulfolactate phosphatase [Parvicella tangerina]|uniref:Probable 2-phosphosulfolactate phosphatase n=1 Tax=Parvicella tangerina TaxID=2829795 RepID=A0A916JNA5_9FLAO|nr:2-phosphosulfolactate phosphatase [Parvicella tangerina]CAG5081764.1 putative 2-phosphosulfolactate phosphatase [Parvicella tangerina]
MSEDSRPRVEVCFTPRSYELYNEDVDIVVCIDVLRATSAICTAFEYGVKKMIPVATLEEAIEYRQKGFIVAAERKGQIVEGFELGNSPRRYLDGEFDGKTIVITTTNGTKAIHTARKAQTVVIGSLLNLDALSEWLIKQERNVMLLGSGWKETFCLEDTICAGAFVDQLQQSGGFRSEFDSTIAAKYLYLSAKDNYFGYLKASSHRRRLKALNLNEDIKFCLTPNQTSVIPILRNGVLEKL